MFGSGARESLGSLIAASLASAWRHSPTPIRISAHELDEIAPLLLVSGTAALGWWRVRHSDLRTSPSAAELHQAYRLYTLQAALQEQDIEQVFTLLRSAGVEPVLAKGWAIARLYPEEGLRACGDIDLYVRPAQYAAALAVLKGVEGKKYDVDLDHEECTRLDARRWDELYACSQLVRLGEVYVRVLGPEDHLRFLCLHLLRHGAWRPLWLCDVAVALERRTPDFDWQCCLGDNPRERHLVTCGIGLAHQLFGANIDDTPVATEAKRLPRWLVPSVLKSWNNPSSDHHEPQQLAHTYLRHPRGVLEGMRRRWRTPVRVSIEMSAPFNDLPRLPFQVAHYFVNSLRFLARVPRDHLL